MRILDDPGGAEAARFGAETSGAVRLYDGSGRLLFAGGITPGRGRSGGESDGSAAGLDAALAGRPAGPGAAPVFGCPLRDPEPIRRGARR